MTVDAIIADMRKTAQAHEQWAMSPESSSTEAATCTVFASQIRDWAERIAALTSQAGSDPQARQEWQPIESAPKNETFLAFQIASVRDVKYPRLFLCSWHQGDALNPPRWHDGMIGAQPTHWMPLPAPPSAPERRQE